MRNYKIASLLCFVLFTFVSCASKTSIQPKIDKNTSETPVRKIVYLFFEAEKSSENDIVKLVDKKVYDGSFKNEDFGTSKEIGNTYYKIILTDKNNKVYKISIIDNPLSPVFESYAENSMEKQIGKLSKAEFFYRYNDNGNLSKLEIYKFENNKSTLVFNLNL